MMTTILPTNSLEWIKSESKEAVELAVIINSFNRLELLRESLSSVVQALNLTFPRQSAVVIFDAGSTDGSIDFVKDFATTCATHTEAPSIICLCPPENTDRSFSAGCNVAIHTAAQKFPQLKWCLLFETDNFISNPKALSLAVKLLEQEKQLAAVGFTLEGTAFCSRFPRPLAFAIGQQLSHRLGLERMEINHWYPFAESRWGLSEVVYTSPLLIRYTAWKETEGMDATRFPFSGSDHDWCWIAHEKRWKEGDLDVTGVVHDNKTMQSAWSANRVIDFHRSRLRLLIKHRGTWVAILKPLLFSRHCLEILLLIFISLYSERANKSLNQRFVLVKTLLKNYE
jgi:GT2 family glycosyltransferase